MKERTLFVSDMDGTLLNSQSELSPSTIERLNTLINDKGVLFTVATARTPATATILMKDVKSNIPYILMTGAALWDPQQSCFSNVRTMSNEAVEQILEVFAKHHVAPFVYRRHGNTLIVHHSHNMTEREKDFMEPRVQTPLKQLRLCDKIAAHDVDEAMLVFLNVYGYESLKQMSAAQVKDSVDKIWNEIILVNTKKDQTVLPKLDPVEPKKSILDMVIRPSGPSNLKVAFVYDKTPANSVWTYSHELGRMDMENKLGDSVDSRTFCNVDTQTKLVECLNRLVDEKYDVIFTTGPEMLPEALKVAVLHPEIKILNCSLSLANSHVRTYYARMYEVKFLTGMIAGSLCADGQIGYVADYPIFGTTANINAFAIGARMVNPRAKIYLQWTKVKDADPQKFFEKNGITYISDRDMIMPDDASRNFGLYHYDQNGEVVNLAMPFYNWGAFYERILRSILEGNWKQEEKNETANAVSYWWGMSAGIVDVICSKHLPSGTKKLISMMSELIREGAVTPFSGKLTSQNGIVRNEDDGAMLHEDILKMDWLAENVVGMLPGDDDLVDDAKNVVALQGVDTPESLELKSVPDVK